MKCSLVPFFVMVLLAACTNDGVSPTGSEISRLANVERSVAWGPETPHFNLQVVLRGNGFGLVKFRQPNDDQFTVYLDVWVRDLSPNTSYTLQRAVDTVLDGQCVSSAWLSLGHGLSPQSVVTDETGTGGANLFRSVPSSPGQTFDIHFRVIEDASGAVVLQSDCYQYTISI